MARPISGATWLTRSTLNSIKQRSLLIEIDQTFLGQIHRIIPAKLAGFCVWTGEFNSEVWVKWHWYFDEGVKQFVVPLHGITSNIVLISPSGEISLPDADLARHALRRIRRRHDWQPWLQLHTSRRTPRAPIDANAPPREPVVPTPRAPPAPATPPDTEKWEPEELCIMRLIRQGCRRKQIASQLSISTATVDRRLANIRNRLGVSVNGTIGEVAAWHGLI